MLGGKSILLIGLSNSGKSHFGAQLDLRLSLTESRIKRFTASQNNLLFKDVKNNLLKGLASQHTPSQTYKNMDFSLTFKDQKFDLIWQDYAGEQIKEIFDKRNVDDKWQKDIKESKSWMLFIRVEDLKIKKDIINQKPEFRIIAFLNAHKKGSDCKIKELVPFTRQEIANFTGLRVETVIRAFAKMKLDKKIDIINHKIYF